MGPRLLALGAICCLGTVAGTADAADLTVTPVSLAVASPSQLATLKIVGAQEPLAAQIRVVRWQQHGGREQLTPTRDVVASPPALRLGGGREMTVRIVRTVKSPVAGEECYRVLVDQLPGASQDGIAVKFALRQSIPLCFDAPKQKRGEMAWSLRREGKQWLLSASNSSQRRIVAKNVKISGAGGASARLGVAVVLGASDMSWPVTGQLKGLAPGSSFTVDAKIDNKDVQFKGKAGGG